MKKISGYIFSFIAILLCSSPGFAQSERTVGLRFGFDISRLSLYYFQPERKNFEFSSDVELFKKVYPTLELGLNNIKLNKDSLYDYYSNGYYTRIGVDYNFLKTENINAGEMMIGGIRYGHAFFSHYAENIFIKDSYWGNFNGDLSKKTLNAQWIEFVAGLRTEVIKNFFLGWTLRGRILISKSKNNPTEPYWIPGFGKGSATSSFGFNFSIFYNIPLYKVSIRK